MISRSLVHPPFVGRAPQLAQLQQLLQAAAAGAPQLAVVHGPAGIGKTRLAEELAVRARARGALVAAGRGWQDGEAPPLWPWHAILETLAAPADLVDDAAARPGDRFARFLAIRAHLRDRQGPRPVVIVLDDAHLADEASLQLTRFLSGERDLPLLMLVLWRTSDDLSPRAIELWRQLSGGAVTLELQGLSDDAVDVWVAAALDRPVDAETRLALRSITRGSPLQLRSLVVDADGRSSLEESLERTIRRLLDRLPDAERRTLALAALAGLDVSAFELASLADTTPTAVSEVLAWGRDRGLLTASATERLRFVHEIVRREAAATLTSPERLDAHARLVGMQGGAEPDRAVRRAHHAMAAAPRSRADGEMAVALAREAAGMLKTVDGFDAAALILRRAVEIQASLASDAGLADVRVEQADAELACGRLAEARVGFLEAARAAERESNPILLARAALGLGGVWINEHRLTTEAEAVLALQRRALMALPADAHVLRALLSIRIVAEEAYRTPHAAPLAAGAAREAEGSSHDDAMAAALTTVRATGDRRALAQALSIAHHVRLTPDRGAERLAMAEEMLGCAADCGDRLLMLVARCWQAVDLFQLARPAAHGALDELHHRAALLQCRSVAFIAKAMDTMLAIRAGDFVAAESLADACFALGREAGDADALAYRAAHVSAIRYFQGREAELPGAASTIAASSSIIEERDRAFASAAALFALRAGRPAVARALLGRLQREGLASIPSSSSWLVTLVGIVEMASDLGDGQVADLAYRALLPYAPYPAMASLSIVCFGSLHRTLAVAARTSGHLDLAIEHFTAAIAANEELGHRPAAIQARAELALARLARGTMIDEREGPAQLVEACAAGAALGMGDLAARWRAAGGARSGAIAARDVEAVSLTALPGGRWRAALDGRVATVSARVGVRYLAELVAAPDREISALALMTNGDAVEGGGDDDLVMDRRARQELRRRIEEIRTLDAPSTDERRELEILVAELARASGFGGRLRTFVDAPERARTAVRKAIKRAIDEIARANPDVGRHLLERIETGAVCCYRLRGASAVVGAASLHAAAAKRTS